MANRDEVEEFLRRAAARRAAAQQQQQRPPAPPQQPPAWTPPPAPPPQPFPPPRPPQPFAPQPGRRPASLSEVVILEPVQPVEAEVVDAELAAEPDRLGKYVAQDLRGAQEIAEHTRQLGAEVDRADDKLEAHLHQIFDHSVGRLKKQATDSVPQTPEVGEATTPTFAKIAEMMRSPQAIRDAIILSEVLHRPEERW